MQKTKLGISVELLAALMYFVGLINLLGLLIVAGYVLICEKDEWLKRCAVTAVALSVVFALIGVVIGFGSNVFGLFNSILSNFSFIHFSLSYPLHIDNFISHAASLAEKALFVVLGVMALKHKGFQVPGISGLVGKHMGDIPQVPVQPQAPMQAQMPVQQVPAQPQAPMQGQVPVQQVPVQPQQPVDPSAQH